MNRKGWVVAGALVAVLAVLAVAATWGWWGASRVEEDTTFIVPSGATVTSVAHQLEEQGLIGSAEAFLMWAKVLGSSDPIKAGEFLLPAGATPSQIPGSNVEFEMTGLSGL